MKEVPGSSLEFECEADETVTIDVTATNTKYIVQPATAAHVTVEGQKITVKVGDRSRNVTIAFGFSIEDGGGSYDLVFNGNKGDLKFFRNISQGMNQPIRKTYEFIV